MKKVIGIALLACFLAYAVFDFVLIDTGLLDSMTAYADERKDTQYSPPAQSVFPPASEQDASAFDAPPAPHQSSAPQAAPPPTLMPIPLAPAAPPAIREVPHDVYAPSYEEQQEFAPDYSDYVGSDGQADVYTEEFADEYYDGETFVTSDGVELTLEDAEFLLACIDGKAAGRRVSPKCPRNAVELLGQGR